MSAELLSSRTRCLARPRGHRPPQHPRLEEVGRRRLGLLAPWLPPAPRPEVERQRPPDRARRLPGESERCDRLRREAPHRHLPLPLAGKQCPRPCHRGSRSWAESCRFEFGGSNNGSVLGVIVNCQVSCLLGGGGARWRHVDCESVRTKKYSIPIYICRGGPLTCRRRFPSSRWGRTPT